GEAVAKDRHALDARTLCREWLGPAEKISVMDMEHALPIVGELGARDGDVAALELVGEGKVPSMRLGLRNHISRHLILLKGRHQGCGRRIKCSLNFPIQAAA